MSHSCQCQSTDRRLGVVFGVIGDDNRAVRDAAERFGWEWSDDLGAAAVPVGPNATLAGPAELFDLLSGIVGDTAAGNLPAAWLEPEALESQAGTLLRAGRLGELAPQGDSPLGQLLEQGRIETWFQPIVRAGSETTWGYECLMRARDLDDDSIISPGRIIDWARRENLLFTLDRVCRETHVRNAAQHNDGGGHHYLINFLPTVIYQPEFCLRTTVRALTGTGLDPGQVVFEVVETEQVDDREHLRAILKYYRDNGFGMALDDVTAGYAGLALLADLDPNLAKIDREVVWASVSSRRHADICRAIIDYAHKQSIPALAEGVETAEQRDLMTSLGIDLLQGYFFGRPGPPAEG